MSEQRRILVVDDEPQIIRVMRQILSAHSFSIRTASDGDSGFELFNDWQPELVITDLQMPNVSGIELCRKIRQISDVPIIILSVRNDEKTIVQALDGGADDYVTKPFSSNELLARVRAHLRRISKKPKEILENGAVQLDVVAHKVRVNQEEIHLTPKEFELLAVLMRHPDKVLTHRFLLTQIWGDYYTESPEALRVLVGALRKKIEIDSANPTFILTEPWIGYRFSPQSL